jgi:UPF0042 nucleotide-binding protein
MKNLRIVVITGLSGSGKSTVIKAMEDMGFFCVDNLPVVLLPKFLELHLSSSGEVSKVALVIDIREKEYFQECIRIFTELKKAGFSMEIIFLESSDEALIRRFSETRRQHPLAQEGLILEGIRSEREKLRGLKKMADKVIDTSKYNVHQLKEVIFNHFSRVAVKRKMAVTLLSFGYKYGTPYDADLLIDVRFLANPYFVEGLKSLDGFDPEISEYVLKSEAAVKFLGKFCDLMRFLLPLYEKEGKAYLTIAVGCTGGRHRSVVIIDELKGFLEKEEYLVKVSHRDIDKV